MGWFLGVILGFSVANTVAIWFLVYIAGKHEQKLFPKSKEDRSNE